MKMFGSLCNKLGIMPCQNLQLYFSTSTILQNSRKTVTITDLANLYTNINYFLKVNTDLEQTVEHQTAFSLTIYYLLKVWDQGLSTGLGEMLFKQQKTICVRGVSISMPDIACGIPQVSVLGPKLFIFHINDICIVSRISQLVLVADGNNIFCFGGDLQEQLWRITTNVCKLKIWFDRNKLSLNLSKTIFNLFGNCNKNT